jgi:hypothetical protein
MLLILTHDIAVFSHEYAHGLMAWILGYKTSPFDINYGGTSWANILLLLNIDQAVDNNLIYSQGHPFFVGLIALAGPGINVLLYIVSYYLMQQTSIRSHAYLFYFLFLFNLMNLGNVYDYVPIRTFATSGVMVDILDIEQGFNISPWIIYGIVGYLVLFMIWQFFVISLPLAYRNLGLKSTAAKVSLLILCVLILFGWFALPGFFSHGAIPFFISATSFFAIPGIIYLMWPETTSNFE